MGVRTACWVGLLLLVTACGQGSGGAAGSGSAGGPSVTGRVFLSTGVTADGKDRPLAGSSRIRLDFATQGRIGLQAGCNTMSGAYRLQGDRLSLTEGLTSTEMGCPEPLMQQDTWLAGLFTAGVTLALDGDVLTVRSGSTTIQLLDERVAVPDSDLWRTLWLLDGVDTGEVVSSTAVGTTPSLRFVPGPPDRVEVRTGCNSGSGPVTAADGSATFGAVALTRRACVDPAATAVEKALLAVLQGDGPARYTVKGDRLRLRRGGVTLHFRAGPTQTVQPDQAVSSAP